MTSLRLTAYAAVLAVLASCDRVPEPWSVEEVAIIESLSLRMLPPLPPDPTNAVAGDPEAAAFGKQLFFDPRFSANGAVSCATCHQPERRFTDGLPKGVAIGISKRNTPSIVGTAYSPWLYWDGRRDSQWSQALSPLEDPNEHGSDRETIVGIVLGDDSYRSQYEALFGEPGNVDSTFANIGKVIAAFERTIMPTASRFDDYVDAVTAGDERRQAELFTGDEVHGLRLFIGEANCTQCHNGPLLSDFEHHAVCVPQVGPGKVEANEDRGLALETLDVADNYKFRTPALRNVALTGPWMHDGAFTTLEAAVRHHLDPLSSLTGFDVNQLPAPFNTMVDDDPVRNAARVAALSPDHPMSVGLSESEFADLMAFLHALTDPASLNLLGNTPDSVPSGLPVKD